MSLALTFLPVLLPERLRHELPAALRNQALAIMNSLPLAQSFPLGSVERTAINSAYLYVFKILILIAIVTSAMSLLVMLCMEDITLSDDKQGADAVHESGEQSVQGGEKV